MRVVFDTNILVSAITLPTGRAAEALNRVVVGPDHLIISQPIVAELLLVLARKFSRDGESLSRLALYLSDLAEFVIPATRISILAGEPDNRILECAVTGHAQAIVTGDLALLALKRFQSIPLLSLRAYLATASL